MIWFDLMSRLLTTPKRRCKLHAMSIEAEGKVQQPSLNNEIDSLRWSGRIEALGASLFATGIVLESTKKDSGVLLIAIGFAIAISTFLVSNLEQAEIKSKINRLVRSAQPTREEARSQTSSSPLSWDD